MLGTPRLARRFALAASACVAALAALAVPASAGTIRYTAAPSSAYSVDNDHGILKVTFNTCATAGATQTVGFTLDTEVTGKGSGTGTFKVMKSDGGSLAFDPSTVALAPGRQQTRVNVTVSTPAPSAKGAFFRFKIDPENGVGIGQGPGVMIRFACILSPGPGATAPQPRPQACPAPVAATRRHPNKNDGKDGDPTDGNAGRGNDDRGAPQPSIQCQSAPAPACPQATTRANKNDGKDGDPTDGNAGRGNDDRVAPQPDPQPQLVQAEAPSVSAPQPCPPAPVAAASTTDSTPTPAPAPVSEAPISTPTQGVFAPLSAAASRSAARCVATPRRLRVRKGELTQLAVTVRANGTAIRSAAVRVLGAGVNRIAHTGRDGTALVSVRPTQTGRLVVQSDVCFGVDRLRVLAAKDASSGVAPAFTG